MSHIKLNKQQVDDALKSMKKMIEVGKDDLAAFEKVAAVFLTEQNVASSKTLKKLKETHDNKAKGRKQAIENAITNLGIGSRALTEYAEAFEMT